MRRLIHEARVGRLATVTADGLPHVVPCCFVVDGDIVYSAVDDVKPKSSMRLARVANVEAHPAAALLLDHYDEDWARLWWIRLDGRVRVIDADGLDAERPRQLLADKYDQYRRKPPPGPVLALTIERCRAWP